MLSSQIVFKKQYANLLEFPEMDIKNIVHLSSHYRD